MKIRVRVFNSIYDFIDTCQTKFRLKHNLVLRDNPKTRQLGVLDQNTGEWLLINVDAFKSYVKNSCPVEIAKYVWSEEGRKQLFCCN